MDFWLGEWDVSFTGHEGVVAEGVQRSLDQGCAILEDFHTFSGIEGHGLFAYDPAMHKWRQSYVDTSGSYSTLRGEFENGAMTFDFVDTPSSLNGHVHIQRINADTVHLWSETQNPETHAWSILFDLTYHRRANTH